MLLKVIVTLITCYAGVNVNQPPSPKKRWGFVRNFTQNTAKFLWYWGSCTKPSDVASACVAPCKGIRIPESEKIWLVKSGILGSGIRNTAQGIRNPTNDWNPESKISMTNSGIQYLESEIHCVESRIQNCLGFSYMEQLGASLARDYFIKRFLTKTN